MAGNNNVCKTIWKKRKQRKHNEKYVCCFFKVWNLKSTITYKCGRVVLSHTSANSYSFHLPCTILSNVYFYICTFTFLFLFDWSQSKAVLLIKWVSHLCFCIRSTISQLNKQTATAEKEKLYTLSNIIYIQF